MKLLLCAGLALASAPAFAQSNTTSQPATASLAAEPTVAAIAPSNTKVRCLVLMGPFSQSDRHDAPRLIYEFVPCKAAMIDGIVIGCEDSVG